MTLTFDALRPAERARYSGILAWAADHCHGASQVDRAVRCLAAAAGRSLPGTPARAHPVHGDEFLHHLEASLGPDPRRWDAVDLRLFLVMASPYRLSDRFARALPAGLDALRALAKKAAVDEARLARRLLEVGGPLLDASPTARWLAGLIGQDPAAWLAHLKKSRQAEAGIAMRALAAEAPELARAWLPKLSLPADDAAKVAVALRASGEKAGDEALLVKLRDPLTCLRMLEAPGSLDSFPLDRVRPILEAHLAKSQRRPGDGDALQEAALLWLARHGRVAALPLLLKYRERDLAWRRGFLLEVGKLLRRDGLPVLEAFLDPKAFFPGTKDTIPREEFVADVVAELRRRGADRKRLAAVAARFKRSPLLFAAASKAASARPVLSLADLATPSSLASPRWAADVAAALSLNRSDWSEKRAGMEAGVRLLRLPRVARHPQWGAIVRRIIDQTQDFRRWSREVSGRAVSPDEDAGGLLETYLDDGRCTTDLAYKILLGQENSDLRRWFKLLKHALTVKARALGSASLADELLPALLKPTGDPALRKAMLRAHPYAKL